MTSKSKRTEGGLAKKGRSEGPSAGETHDTAAEGRLSESELGSVAGGFGTFATNKRLEKTGSNPSG